MSIGDIIRSVLELATILFVIYGLFHEDKFVAFEEKLFARIWRSRFKIVKGGGRYRVGGSLPQRKSV